MRLRLQTRTLSAAMRLRWLILGAVSSAALECGKNHAWVDAGANDGQSLSWFARNRYSSGRYTAVVAFEMNPLFQPSLQTVLRPLHGELELGAVWTNDGTMSANMQTPKSRTAMKGGVLYNMTSSALEVGGVPLNKRMSQRARASVAHEQRTNVRTIDFAFWLASRFCREDIVDLKMDIEGAEFEVLEHLLRTGRANLIDTLQIEWHTTKRGAGGARVTLNGRKEQIMHGLQQAGVRVSDWKAM